MDADSPVLAAGRRAGLVRLVVAALTTAVAIRGVTWLATFFIIGPVLGPASFGLAGTSLGKDAPVALEGFLLLAAITVTILIAVGLHRDEEQWLGRARRFGWLLVYDTVFYVGSAVVAVVVWGGVDNLRDQAPGLVALAVVNVPIAWLGWRVARRAHS